MPLFLCLNCENQILPKKSAPGSVMVELLLILLSLVALPFSYYLAGGLFLLFIGYGVWRLANKQTVCPLCSALHPIPLDSPAAQKVLGR